MNKEQISGTDRAAILLLCLGEEASARVFEELSDDEITLISRSMAAFTHIPAWLRDEVLSRYRQERQALAGIFVNGEEFARNTIRRSAASERVETLLNQQLDDIPAALCGRLSSVKPQVVAELLDHEHPQSIALVLSILEAAHASAVISLLPERLQAEVIHRLATLEYVSEEVMAGLEDFFEEAIDQSASDRQARIAGFARAVDLLNKMDSGLYGAILDKLADTDQDLAARMRKNMYSFEGLIHLNDQILQATLREVSNDALTLALKTASHELKNKFFTNMSGRAAEMIREDLETIGSVRMGEVEAMQESIVRTALRLKDREAVARR